MKYLRKIDENRAPPGMERVLLRIAPPAALMSIAIPAAVALLARWWLGAGAEKAVMRVDIAAIAVAVTSLTAVFTVAIGAVIVFIMKGPGYVADAYEVNDAAEPAPETSRTRTDPRRSGARPPAP